MEILDNLLMSLQGDVPVRSILVGSHWIAVCSRHCGLAAALTSNLHHKHAPVRDAGCLHLKSARELAQYALSDNLLEASIGVAAINSMLDVDESQTEEINALEVLTQHGQGKTVALVGHFPFIPKLRTAVGQLWVIEKRPVNEEYPAEAAPELIPKADLVAISGSTLINHTLGGLLALCRPEALVMVLGPSTPLSPVMFNYGVALLSGARGVNEAAVLRSVGQGAPFQQIEGVRLLTMRRNDWNFHSNSLV